MIDASVAAQRAEQLEQLGRYADVERVARQGLAAHPGDVRLLLALSEALRRTGRPGEALWAADAAAAQRPDRPAVHVARGRALLALGNHRAACAVTAYALSLDPEHLDALYVHTVARHAVGDLDAARATVLHAIALDPQQPAGHYLLGRVARRTGDRATAVRALREALRLDPGHVEARLELGRVEGQYALGPRVGAIVDAGAMDPGRRVLGLADHLVWNLVWRVRIGLGLGTVLVVGTADSDAEEQVLDPLGPVLGSRIGALVLLALVVLGLWRFAARLPPGGRRVIAAVVRSDRLLTGQVLGVGALLALHLAVVVTGLVELAVLALLLLLGTVPVQWFGLRRSWRRVQAEE